MPQVAVWTGQAITPECRLVIVGAPDEAEFEEHRRAGLVSEPETLCVLAPAPPSRTHFLAHWIGHTHFENPQFVDLSLESTHFFSDLSFIVDFPLVVTDEFLKRFLRLAPRDALDLFDGLGPFVEFVERFFTNGTVKLIGTQGTQWNYSPGSEAAKDYCLAGELKSNHRRCIDAVRRLMTHRLKFAQYHDAVDKLARIFERIESTNLIDRFDAMSETFALSAEFQLRTANPSVAIVYWHRALDAFLLARAFDAEIVKLTGRGVVFRDTSLSVRDPSVSTCIDALVRSRHICLPKGTRERVRNCNDIRNRSVLTHSNFGASIAYAKRYRGEVLDCLRSINDDKYKSFRQTLDSIVDSYTLSMKFFFGFHSALDCYLVREQQRS